MTRGIWIILENGSGELDRRFIETTDVEGDQTQADIMMMIRDVADNGIYAGDSIRFEEGESEIV